MAKKKIFDIIPANKRKEILSKDKGGSVKSSSSRASEKGTRPVFAFSKKKNIGALILIIVIIAIYWFFSSAKTVKIVLEPKLTSLTVNTSIAFSSSSPELVLPLDDLSQSIIPVEPIEVEKTFTKEFASPEISIGEKAQGIIRVYNKHSRTISLVKDTRFLSSSEPTRQFHAQSKLTIPAGGYLDVSVIASEASEDYNIEPCVFSVPGLRNFSPPQLYYDIFGESFSNMEGGRKSVIRKVSQESLEQAEQELLKIAQDEIKTVLEDAAGSDFEILDSSIELELIEGGATNAKEGQEIDSFIYELKVKAVGLKAKQSFLLDFAKSYIAADIVGYKDFAEESLIVKFLPQEGQGVNENKASLEISTKIYSRIDEDSLSRIVKGRNRKEISRYVLEICPDLSKPPRIEFWPFWTRRAKAESENVEISISFE